MSLESIRARVEAATEGRFSFIVEGMWRFHSGDCPYAGEDWDSDSKPGSNCTACQCIALMHHDIPLLLKVAEAAKKLDGFEPEDIDCEVWDADYQEAVKVLRAALAELEADNT